MEQYGFPHRYPHKRSFIRGICRQFMNGSCRFGSSCHFLHQSPVLPSAQICRYFQKGGCWFGESCRYLHILQPDGEATTTSRRGSAPVVHTPWVAYVLPDRRGSEPTLLQAQGFSSQHRRGSESVLTHVANLQNNFGHQTTNITEEDLAEGSSSPQQQEVMSQFNFTVPQVSVQQSPKTSAQILPYSNLLAEAGTSLEGQKQDEGSSQEAAELGGAAAPSDQVQTDSFNKSKDVTCGICMDKVYEKTSSEERRFGILPNCSHSFCLGCIVTWRKTKNFQEEVIKGCPQCRVKSSFYIPSKYWVEGQPKETLITTFREKCSKRKCSFFMRHGCCPFKAECLYAHDLPHGYRPHRRRHSTHSHHAVNLDDLLDQVMAMTLLYDMLNHNDYDDDDEFPMYHSDEYDLF